MSLTIFQFEQQSIRYVGDRINHEWVAQDVFDAIKIPKDESSKFLEFKEVMTFADCLGFAAAYPNYNFASKLKDFVIEISGAELWRAVYVNQYMMFSDGYMLWASKYGEEWTHQDIFSKFYKCGKIPAFKGFQLIDKKEWSKIGCLPDFLFRDEDGLVPGEMKKGIFNANHLKQLQRYMKVMKVSRGIAVAPKLSQDLTLPKGIDFITYQPITYEEYCAIECQVVALV